MSFEATASSRAKGQPVSLYLFQGDVQTEFQLENMLRSVAMIPGATEFGYATTVISKDGGAAENWLNGGPNSDFTRSLDQLLARAPNLEHVSLVVSWHGTDLRVGECQIKPKVEIAAKVTTPWLWQVGSVDRDDADVVSQISGNPAIGGAPADRSVYEAIVALKAKGLRVTLYPFIIMDIPSSNSLPDPYGGSSQPAYPWRGRITCHPAAGQPGTVDKTAAAATQVNAFFGTVTPSDFGWNGSSKVVTYSGPSNEWSFRRLILHMATIAHAAGADDFLIGSEMVGLTTIRSNANTYPAVAKLVALASDARTILGGGVRISYGADWSEFHSHRPGDGSNDIYFNLDPLWASNDIDYVGIDNYLPIADWRDGDDHLDLFEGWRSIYDLGYLQSNIEGGENYDWYYASQADRDNQVRSLITDGLGKPWVYRNKDIRNWWANAHYNRPGGVESGSPTGWVAESKPIVFTELGCPAVNKGANQPNLFVDAKSSESDFPHYSTHRRDTLIQRAFLEAWLMYWEGARNPASTEYSGPMLELGSISIWTWDARPYPAFPKRSDFWGDAANWEVGHWLNGRMNRIDKPIGRAQQFAYTDAERPVTYMGVTYQPLPIKAGNVNASGKLDKSTFEVRVPRDTELADQFRIYPPSQPITLIMRQGHLSDPSAEFLAVWAGRVLSSSRQGNESVLACEPMSSSLRRPGLRRYYQLGCPFVLYGPGCKASEAAATQDATVESIDGTTITLPVSWNSIPTDKYKEGMVKWVTTEGTLEIRKILKITAGRQLLLSGYLRGLSPGDDVSVILGCNHQMSDCADLHDNILNFGGCFAIPLQNPVSPAVNNFY